MPFHELLGNARSNVVHEAQLENVLNMFCKIRPIHCSSKLNIVFGWWYVTVPETQHYALIIHCRQLLRCAQRDVNSSCLRFPCATITVLSLSIGRISSAYLPCFKLSCPSWTKVAPKHCKQMEDCNLVWRRSLLTFKLLPWFLSEVRSQRYRCPVQRTCSKSDPHPTPIKYLGLSFAQ